MRFLKHMAALTFALFATACGCVRSQEATDGETPVSLSVSLDEPGWPQWRGPRRDGRSDETGLLQSWPDGGPPLLWKASGIGRGFSQPIITGADAADTIFVTGDFDRECRILALTPGGKLKWQVTNGAAWTKNHPGARSSCTYAGGRLYHMNAHGRVVCLDAARGDEVWHVDTLERFDGRENQWGLAESVLVDGGRVHVTPGGTKAFMAALDARTGETVWTSEPMPSPRDERTGYSSPILVRFGKRRVLVNLSEKSVVGVDAETGRQLWRFLHPTKYDANCATPVLWNGHLFHTNPSGAGCVMLRMLTAGNRAAVEPIWEGPLDNISGGAVVVEGFVYGAAQNNYKGKNVWMCLAASTGNTQWESTELVQGSVTYADGRLYCLAEDGTMALVKASPEAFEIAGQFRLVEKKVKDAWAHPVIFGGKLYLRYHDELRCYDIRRR